MVPQEFAIGTQTPISASSVRVVRDVFAELLRDMNRSDARTLVERASHGFVVVKHLHDEASMRLCSLTGWRKLIGMRRTRSSKVQRKVVSLHTSWQPEEPFSFLCELQPLARKCAATIATSHRKTMRDFFTSVFSAEVIAARGVAATVVPRRRVAPRYCWRLHLR